MANEPFRDEGDFDDRHLFMTPSTNISNEEVFLQDLLVILKHTSSDLQSHTGVLPVA